MVSEGNVSTEPFSGRLTFLSDLQGILFEGSCFNGLKCVVAEVQSLAPVARLMKWLTISF